MKIITIPNLDKYQHYKESKPVWIKLYCDILQDEKFLRLTDRERWYYIGLLVICVKNMNVVPLAPCRLASRLSLVSKNINKSLLKMRDLGLICIKEVPNDYIRNLDKLYTKNMPIRREEKRREKKRNFHIPFKEAKDIIKEKLTFK